MLTPPPPNFILFQLDFDVKFTLLHLLLFLIDLKSTIINFRNRLFKEDGVLIIHDWEREPYKILLKKGRFSSMKKLTNINKTSLNCRVVLSSDGDPLNGSLAIFPQDLILQKKL